MREPHWVVFGFKAPVRIDAGYLRITLDSGTTIYGQHGLGRFRLSMTDNALDRLQLRQDIRDGELADLGVATAKAHAQLGRNDEAVASLLEALKLAPDRAGIARIVGDVAPFEAVLERLAERAANDGRLQAELSRQSAALGNAPLAARTRARARAWYEGKLAADLDNSSLADELTQVLLDGQQNQGAAWTVFKPSESKSKAGTRRAIFS